MKAILIDDESLALDYLEKLIRDIHGIEIIGKYINPELGFEAIMKKKPDVVFLDIEMPSMSGIELADKIQNTYSDIKIVFITAFNEYAVKAFELNAVDYLMKPVRRKRINETINRLISYEKAMPAPQADFEMIYCFRSLELIRSKVRNESIDVRWRTSKAKEIFAFLIHHRGKSVRKDELIELFWPDVEWDRAFTQLYSTIYQIRRTLNTNQFPVKITSNNNSYMLDLKEVKLDVDEWEKEMENLLLDKNVSFSEIHDLLDLYNGDYFEAESYLWAESERERLRLLWLHYIKKFADLFMDREEFTNVILLYQRVQGLNPFLEDSYFMLMKLYDKLGDRSSVETQYHKLADMLLEEYGVQPNSSIRNWYQNWKNEMKHTYSLSE